MNVELLWIPFWCVAAYIAYQLIHMLLMWAIGLIRWARGE